MTSSMTAYGKTAKAILVYASIAVAIAAITSPASAQTNNRWDLPIATTTDGLWHVEFVPVPSVLRMHVPTLPSDSGLLVQQIEPGSEAAKLGLHVGDVLLEVNGIPMTSPADLPRLDRDTRAVSLHHGKVYNLSLPQMCVFPLPRAAQSSSTAGVSASSFAGGNESVSVSSIGDQHTIEMALPELTDTMIRVQGTRNQIEQKILDANLPPQAKQRVLSSIGGTR